MDSTDYSYCGENGFDCVDPTSECFEQSELFSDCRGVLEYMNNGFCDGENNNEVKTVTFLGVR